MNRPYYRQDRQQWMLNVPGGKQIVLAKGPREATEAEAQAKWAARQATTEASPTTLGALIDRYLAWVKTERSPATYASYSRYLNAWKELHGHRPADTIRGEDVETLVQQRYTKGYSDSVKWQCKKACIVAFSWLKSLGLIDHNPLAGYKKNVQCGVRMKFIVQAQFDALIDCCYDPAFSDLLNVMWAVGCRPAEIFQAKAKHFNRERRTLTFRHSDGDYVKGKKPNRVCVIVLSVKAYEIVCRLADQCGDGYLFKNAEGSAWTISACTRRLDTLETRCHVRTTMYELRHSYAHRKASEGTPILTLAKLMNTSVKMLESVYTHLGDNHAHMLAAAG